MIRFNKSKGVTLVYLRLFEIVIVMLLVTIVAIIVVSTYKAVKEKAYAAEAKYILRHIWNLEVQYHSSENKYTDILNDIGFVQDPKYRYNYVVSLPGGNSQFFNAKASLDINDDGIIDDVWQINEKNNFIHNP